MTSRSMDGTATGAAESGSTGPVRPFRVAVIGGGLAGIAAALGCADAGGQVTLYEARPRLGGLTHSFRRDLPGGSTADDSYWVDNGQHVFLRCCTEYRELLSRLGVAHLTRLQPRLDIPVRGMVGRPGRRRLRTARLRAARRWRRGRSGWSAKPPGPPVAYQLAGALLRYPWLTATDRFRLPRALRALRRIDPTDDDVDAQSFGDWLARTGQSFESVQSLWELIGVAALNARADQVSLSMAATVFQEALLTYRGAADIGIPAVPLGQLHGDAATEQLRQGGVQLRRRTKVTGIVGADPGWLVKTRSDERDDPYDRVILATDPPAAERLLPSGLVDQPNGWSQRLGSSPILNLHLLLDRQVLDEPFLATVGGNTQWIFDRTAASGVSRAGARVGQYLAVSLSAADDLVDVPVAELRSRFIPELIALLPRLAAAEVIDFFVTRERQATFRPNPGSAQFRPAVTTAERTVALAGAWTQTRWPATMEGAVRSGNDAADAIMNSVG